jgi:NarL family two-component system sensor histidine kinase LiaS
MSKLLKPLRQLRWKLTFSYTAVTVAVLLTLVAVTTLGSMLLMSSASGRMLHYKSLAIAQAVEVRPFLEGELPDTTIIAAWLRSAFSNDWAVIVDSSGKLLAVNRLAVAERMTPDQPFVDPNAADESQELIKLALMGKSEVLGLPNGTILAIAPIISESDEILGAVYVRGFSDNLIPGYSLGNGLSTIVVAAVVITIPAGLIGTLFGRVSSRGLVSRLEGLNSAAVAWGQGDFSVTVEDVTADEIGQLTRRMSQMARQIQDLLHEREDRAILEERNRLARDLHDSVKQQVFATTMTLGTAKTYRENDPVSAWQLVDEALELSHEAQQELTVLIHELRPVKLEEKGLAEAVEEYGSRWSQQTGVEISIAIDGEQVIPPEMEQALFRVAQEALSNAAKHSAAEKVAITLSRTEGEILMKISDDGKGFDPESTDSTGIGLQSMKERIEALGGELIVESAPGNGTRLVARCELE